MDQVRFGVVGMGGRGRLGWLRTLQLIKEARVVAVADRIEPLRREGAALAGIGGEHAYVEAEDLLGRPDVDALAIVTEPEYLVDLAVGALEAGKHVICEVPLAYSLEECWRLVLAAERSGRKFALGEQLTYAAAIRAWRRLVQDRSLGKVIYEAQYLHGVTDDRFWIDDSTGARLTWDQARNNPRARKTRIWTVRHPIWGPTHSLAPLLHVLGYPRITEVTCMGTRSPGYTQQEVPIPDIEVALMRTSDDTILRVAGGYMSPSAWPHHWFHVLGTAGEVETDRRTGDGVGPEGLLWLAGHHMRSRTAVNWEFTPYQPGVAAAAGSGHGGLDVYPVHDFVQSILHDRAPTIDVYRAVEITAATVVAGSSAEQGAAPLPVPDFRPGPGRRSGEAPM
jgi:predicted dehydrogenase